MMSKEKEKKNQTEQVFFLNKQTKTKKRDSSLSMLAVCVCGVLID